MKRRCCLLLILLLLAAAAAGAVTGCGPAAPAQTADGSQTPASSLEGDGPSARPESDPAPAETAAPEGTDSHGGTAPSETAGSRTGRAGAGIDRYELPGTEPTASSSSSETGTDPANETPAQPVTEPATQAPAEPATQPETQAPPEPETMPPQTFTDTQATVYATATVRVRTEPWKNGDILATLHAGDEVKRLAVGDGGWTRIFWQDAEAYVSSKYLSEEKPPEPETQAPDSHPAASYNVAQRTDQFIVVTAAGPNETVCHLAMYQKTDGAWKTLLETDGRIGYHGLYKEKEGDNKTPVGCYSFIKAFGRLPDPGCALGYTQVDDSHHWVDDPESQYYNRFVSTNDPAVEPDWNSTEHLIDKNPSYNYCLALNYNYPECTPYRGCAIFLHGFNNDHTPTHGCIAVSEDSMKFILTHVKNGCRIVIGEPSQVTGY